MLLGFLAMIAHLEASNIWRSTMWLIIKLSFDSGAEREALALKATGGRACLPVR
jgi:hypothetical protein